MSILSVLAALLSGCAKHPDNGISPPVSQPQPADGITPIPLPEGVELTGLFITHQGMQAGPYYLLQTTDAGTLMKITNIDPTNEQRPESDAPNARYFGSADTVRADEYASLVRLEDEAPLRELEQAIVQAGALGWDGYAEEDAMEGVLDSGDSCRLYLELSDGSTVTMQGYNVCPAGFMPLLAKVQAIFEANSDYSRYMADSLTESACVSLFAQFKDGLRTEYRLELMGGSTNRWVVFLQDPDGRILEAGTDIADSRDAPDGLPFDRFLRILSEHEAEKWNGYAETTAGSDSAFILRLTFADGKRYEASGNVYPEGLAAWKAEFVQEIDRFYREAR